MNIIKLKTNNAPSSKNGAKVYNESFRGRYCYAIHANLLVLMKPEDDMYAYYQLVPSNEEQNTIYNYEPVDDILVDDVIKKYGIIKSNVKLINYVPSNPLKDDDGKDIPVIRVEVPGITQEQYLKYEKNSDETQLILDMFTMNIPTLKMEDWEYFIDRQNSPMYRNVEFYLKRNAEVDGAGDISLTLLQRYRAQVAAVIYNGVKNGSLDLCSKKTALLEYYVNDMSNDTIDVIRMMQTTMNTTQSGCGCNSGINTMLSTSPASATGCGCGCSNLITSGISSMTSLTSIVSGCDILKEYRAMMKLYMMNTFGDVDFWRYISENYKVAIDKIMDYTRALAKSGLSIFSNNNKIDLAYGCGIASDTNIARYTSFVNDLNGIADAFEMILKEDYSKISFINTSLATFAKYYEYLQWNSYTVNVYEENWS